jgi:glucose-1-phosphate adenylyltransferase
MLSSYVNAGITDVGLVVHQSYQSLLDHVGSGKDWELSRKHGGLRILPPFSYAERGHGEYRGSMEALIGVSDYLSNIRQDYVVMGWGDTAVNLPLKKIFEQHISTGADITVVCTAKHHGIPQFSEYVEQDKNGFVTDLAIRPSEEADGLESLEVYILSKKLLLEMVNYGAAHDVFHFGHGILRPRLKEHSLKMVPYVHEGYVARIQSVGDYYLRSMELLDSAVRADLFDPLHPIRTKDQSNPSTYYGPESKSTCSLVADGCHVDGEIENCVLFRGVTVEAGAKVSNSVLMQGTVVKAGASLSYVLTDKNVQINEGRLLMGHSNYPLAIAKGAVV